MENGIRKTKEDVAALKSNWLSDPCWDIEDTEGFEDYKEELQDFRLSHEDKWRAIEFNRISHKAIDLGIPENITLARYLDILETRIKSLEDRRV